MKNAFMLSIGLTAATVPVVAEAAGPYVTYNYPPGLTSMGGHKTKTIDCSLFGHLPESPKDLYPTCAAAEASDNNDQKICTDQGKERQHFNFAALYAYKHFAEKHGVCKAKNATIDWQIAAQNATLDYVRKHGVQDPAKGQKIFDDFRVSLMRPYNIPVNPSNPADLEYRKKPENWPTGWNMCPFDEIGEMCKSAMGLDR